MAEQRPDIDTPQALHDLKVTDARWRAILATIRDAVIAIDRQGCITVFNPAAEQIFGYAAAEVLGRNVSMLMPAPYREEHDGYMERYERTGEPRAIGRIRSVDGLRKNGEIFPIELSVSESHVGDDVLYTAILRDMSERLATDSEIRELQRVAQERARLADIGAITAKVVHDLGNPLAAVSMQAQLILRRARRGDFQPVGPVREPAEQILRTLRRLEGLVHEFTGFAREQRLEIHPIAVPPFLSSCAEVWHVLATERGIAIRVGGATTLPPLHADEVMLRRVLDNLIKNAIEAVDQHPGLIEIAASILSSGKMCIAVSDNGPGIPEGLNVFKLFETTKRDGTGIGLAVAKQLIAAHGGSIEHVAHPPRGTTFRIELPVDGPSMPHGPID